MSTLFIWNNCIISHKLDKLLKKVRLGSDKNSHEVTGHASFMIEDHWEKPFINPKETAMRLMEYDKLRMGYDPDDTKTIKLKIDMEKIEKEIETAHFTDQRDIYVSWWPHDSKSSHRSSTPIKSWIKKHISSKIDEEFFRAANPYMCIWQDLLAEKYAPDHIIYIPETDKQRKAMQEKWIAERDKNEGAPSYRMQYKNCSRMAARVLLAGFSSSLKLKTRAWIKMRKIWTPLEVKRIGLKLVDRVSGAKVMTWDKWVDEVVGSAAVSMAVGKQMKALMKRASVRGSSGTKSRFEYGDDGKLDKKGDANHARWLTEVIPSGVEGYESRAADNLGYIYSLDTKFNDAMYKTMLQLKEKLEEVNKDDGTGEAQAFAKAVDIPILAAIPQNDDLRKKSANYQIVGTNESQWGALFAELGENVASAPPMRPTALNQDELLALFDSKDTGGDVVLEPATDADMRGKDAKPKKSLEVIYDDV